MSSMKKYLPTIYESVGTPNLVIGRGAKMGSNTLDRLVDRHDEIKNFNGLYGTGDIEIPQKIREKKAEEHDSQMSVVDSLENKINENFVYVFLLRDVKDKWESGYIEELFTYGFFREGKYGEDKFVIDNPEHWNKIHDTSYDVSWMWGGHADFPEYSVSFEYALCHPNIYFLDLKDLSNPKFLEWAVTRDSRWECVEEIVADNVTPTNKKECVKQYWENYRIESQSDVDKKIERKSKLVCPIYPTPYQKLNSELSVINQKAEELQMTIDFIRERHERYIKL